MHLDEEKKRAFVTDYVRLDVIYRNGGIYLDIDVEVLRREKIALRQISSCLSFDDRI